MTSNRRTSTDRQAPRNAARAAKAAGLSEGGWRATARAPGPTSYGFTLIELLIATAVLSIVTAQVFMVLNTQKRVYISNERVLDVQEDSRTVLDLLTFDTRMAGFMVPKIAALSSVDGGANAADSFCISDVSYFDFPTGGAPSQSLDSASEPFNTAGVTSFAGNNAVNAATLDVDGVNGTNDFGGAGRGIILSDGVRSHCARITNIVGNQITYTPARPPGPGFVTANTRVVPAVIYEHNDMNAVPPALPLSLTRNGLVLATGVEDLQIEYWVDNSPIGLLNGVVDDATEFPVDDLNNQPGAATMDTSAIRRIRISVITRTDRTEGGVSQEFNTQRRPANANRVRSDTADQFKRRRFRTSVLPRNLL